ncbi:hypothetical protein HX008_01530 [Myroides marinus]|nr:hypothetical protein [Myroides marinus]
MKEYLIYNLLQIKMSAKVSLCTGACGMLMVNLMDWWNTNFNYVFVALLLVALDHLLGSVVHLRWLRDFSWKKNGAGLLIKLSMVVIGGVVFEALTHITKEQDFVYSYLKMTTRLIVCIYPGMSAMKNMSIITNGIFPPGSLINLFSGFQKDLDIEKLKKGNNKKEE